MQEESSNYSGKAVPSFLETPEGVDKNDPEEIGRKKQIMNQDGFTAILDINHSKWPP